MKDQDQDQITINGVEYVRRGTEQTKPMSASGVCIVRTRSAGVFAGQITKKNLADGTVEMKDARRLWMWVGAASLSQLAVDGVAKPAECRFPCAVPKIELAEVIEIIPASEQAVKTINKVKPWQV